VTGARAIIGQAEEDEDRTARAAPELLGLSRALGDSLDMDIEAAPADTAPSGRGAAGRRASYVVTMTSAGPDEAQQRLSDLGSRCEAQGLSVDAVWSKKDGGRSVSVVAVSTPNAASLRAVPPSAWHARSSVAPSHSSACKAAVQCGGALTRLTKDGRGSAHVRHFKMSKHGLLSWEKQLWSGSKSFVVDKAVSGSGGDLGDTSASERTMFRVSGRAVGDDEATKRFLYLVAPSEDQRDMWLTGINELAAQRDKEAPSLSRAADVDDVAAVLADSGDMKITAEPTAEGPPVYTVELSNSDPQSATARTAALREKAEAVGLTVDDVSSLGSLSVVRVSTPGGSQPQLWGARSAKVLDSREGRPRRCLDTEETDAARAMVLQGSTLMRFSRGGAGAGYLRVFRMTETGQLVGGHKRLQTTAVYPGLWNDLPAGQEELDSRSFRAFGFHPSDRSRREQVLYFSCKSRALQEQWVAGTRAIIGQAEEDEVTAAMVCAADVEGVAAALADAEDVKITPELEPGKTEPTAYTLEVVGADEVSATERLERVQAKAQALGWSISEASSVGNVAAITVSTPKGVSPQLLGEAAAQEYGAKAEEAAINRGDDLEGAARAMVMAGTRLMRFSKVGHGAAYTRRFQLSENGILCGGHKRLQVTDVQPGLWNVQPKKSRDLDLRSFRVTGFHPSDDTWKQQVLFLTARSRAQRDQWVAGVRAVIGQTAIERGDRTTPELLGLAFALGDRQEMDIVEAFREKSARTPSNSSSYVVTLSSPDSNQSQKRVDALASKCASQGLFTGRITTRSESGKAVAEVEVGVAYGQLLPQERRASRGATDRAIPTDVAGCKAAVLSGGPLARLTKDGRGALHVRRFKMSKQSVLSWAKGFVVGQRYFHVDRIMREGGAWELVRDSDTRFLMSGHMIGAGQEQQQRTLYFVASSPEERDMWITGVSALVGRDDKEPPRLSRAADVEGVVSALSDDGDMKVISDSSAGAAGLPSYTVELCSADEATGSARAAHLTERARGLGLTVDDVSTFGSMAVLKVSTPAGSQPQLWGAEAARAVELEEDAAGCDDDGGEEAAACGVVRKGSKLTRFSQGGQGAAFHRDFRMTDAGVLIGGHKRIQAVAVYPGLGGAQPRANGELDARSFRCVGYHPSDPSRREQVLYFSARSRAQQMQWLTGARALIGQTVVDEANAAMASAVDLEGVAAALADSGEMKVTTEAELGHPEAGAYSVQLNSADEHVAAVRTDALRTKAQALGLTIDDVAVFGTMSIVKLSTPAGVSPRAWGDEAARAKDTVAASEEKGAGGRRGALRGDRAAAGMAMVLKGTPLLRFSKVGHGAAYLRQFAMTEAGELTGGHNRLQVREVHRGLWNKQPTEYAELDARSFRAFGHPPGDPQRDQVLFFTARSRAEREQWVTGARAIIGQAEEDEDRTARAAPELLGLSRALGDSLDMDIEAAPADTAPSGRGAAGRRASYVVTMTSADTDEAQLRLDELAARCEAHGLSVDGVSVEERGDRSVAVAEIGVLDPLQLLSIPVRPRGGQVAAPLDVEACKAVVLAGGALARLTKEGRGALHVRHFSMSKQGLLTWEKSNWGGSKSLVVEEAMRGSGGGLGGAAATEKTAFRVQGRLLGDDDSTTLYFVATSEAERDVWVMGADALVRRTPKPPPPLARAADVEGIASVLADSGEMKVTAETAPGAASVYTIELSSVDAASGADRVKALRARAAARGVTVDEVSVFGKVSILKVTPPRGARPQAWGDELAHAEAARRGAEPEVQADAARATVMQGTSLMRYSRGGHGAGKVRGFRMSDSGELTGGHKRIQALAVLNGLGAEPHANTELDSRSFRIVGFDPNDPTRAERVLVFTAKTPHEKGHWVSGARALIGQTDDEADDPLAVPPRQVKDAPSLVASDQQARDAAVLASCLGAGEVTAADIVPNAASPLSFFIKLSGSEAERTACLEQVERACEADHIAVESVTEKSGGVEPVTVLLVRADRRSLNKIARRTKAIGVETISSQAEELAAKEAVLAGATLVRVCKDGSGEVHLRRFQLSEDGVLSWTKQGAASAKYLDLVRAERGLGAEVQSCSLTGRSFHVHGHTVGDPDSPQALYFVAPTSRDREQWVVAIRALVGQSPQPAEPVTPDMVSLASALRKEHAEVEPVASSSPTTSTFIVKLAAVAAQDANRQLRRVSTTCASRGLIINSVATRKEDGRTLSTLQVSTPSRSAHMGEGTTPSEAFSRSWGQVPVLMTPSVAEGTPFVSGPAPLGWLLSPMRAATPRSAGSAGKWPSGPIPVTPMQGRAPRPSYGASPSSWLLSPANADSRGATPRGDGPVELSKFLADGDGYLVVKEVKSRLLSQASRRRMFAVTLKSDDAEHAERRLRRLQSVCDERGIEVTTAVTKSEGDETVSTVNIATLAPQLATAAAAAQSGPPGSLSTSAPRDLLRLTSLLNDQMGEISLTSAPAAPQLQQAYSLTLKSSNPDTATRRLRRVESTCATWGIQVSNTKTTQDGSTTVLEAQLQTPKSPVNRPTWPAEPTPPVVALTPHSGPASPADTAALALSNLLADMDGATSVQATNDIGANWGCPRRRSFSVTLTSESPTHAQEREQRVRAVCAAQGIEVTGVTGHETRAEGGKTVSVLQVTTPASKAPSTAVLTPGGPPTPHLFSPGGAQASWAGAPPPPDRKIDVLSLANLLGDREEGNMVSVTEDAAETGRARSVPPSGRRRSFSVTLEHEDAERSERRVRRISSLCAARGLDVVALHTKEDSVSTVTTLKVITPLEPTTAAPGGPQGCWPHTPTHSWGPQGWPHTPTHGWLAGHIPISPAPSALAPRPGAAPLKWVLSPPSAQPHTLWGEPGCPTPAAVSALGVADMCTLMDDAGGEVHTVSSPAGREDGCSFSLTLTSETAEGSDSRTRQLQSLCALRGLSTTVQTRTLDSQTVSVITATSSVPPTPTAVEAQMWRSGAIPVTPARGGGVSAAFGSAPSAWLISPSASAGPLWTNQGVESVAGASDLSKLFGVAEQDVTPNVDSQGESEMSSASGPSGRASYSVTIKSDSEEEYKCLVKRIRSLCALRGMDVSPKDSTFTGRNTVLQVTTPAIGPAVWQDHRLTLSPLFTPTQQHPMLELTKALREQDDGVVVADEGAFSSGWQFLVTTRSDSPGQADERVRQIEHTSTQRGFDVHSVQTKRVGSEFVSLVRLRQGRSPQLAVSADPSPRFSSEEVVSPPAPRNWSQAPAKLLSASAAAGSSNPAILVYGSLTRIAQAGQGSAHMRKFCLCDNAELTWGSKNITVKRAVPGLGRRGSADPSVERRSFRVVARRAGEDRDRVLFLMAPTDSDRDTWISAMREAISLVASSSRHGGLVSPSAPVSKESSPVIDASPGAEASPGCDASPRPEEPPVSSELLGLATTLQDDKDMKIGLDPSAAAARDGAKPFVLTLTSESSNEAQSRLSQLRESCEAGGIWVNSVHTEQHGSRSVAVLRILSPGVVEPLPMWGSTPLTPSVNRPGPADPPAVISGLLTRLTNTGRGEARARRFALRHSGTLTWGRKSVHCLAVRNGVDGIAPVRNSNAFPDRGFSVQATRGDGGARNWIYLLAASEDNRQEWVDALSSVLPKPVGVAVQAPEPASQSKPSNSCPFKIMREIADIATTLHDAKEMNVVKEPGAQEEDETMFTVTLKNEAGEGEARLAQLSDTCEASGIIVDGVAMSQKGDRSITTVKIRTPGVTAGRSWMQDVFPSPGHPPPQESCPEPAVDDSPRAQAGGGMTPSPTVLVPEFSGSAMRSSPGPSPRASKIPFLSSVPEREASQADAPSLAATSAAKQPGALPTLFQVAPLVPRHDTLRLDDCDTATAHARLGSVLHAAYSTNVEISSAVADFGMSLHLGASGSKARRVQVAHAADALERQPSALESALTALRQLQAQASSAEVARWAGRISVLLMDSLHESAAASAGVRQLAHDDAAGVPADTLVVNLQQTADDLEAQRRNLDDALAQCEAPHEPGASPRMFPASPYLSSTPLGITPAHSPLSPGLFAAAKLVPSPQASPHAFAASPSLSQFFSPTKRAVWASAFEMDPGALALSPALCGGSTPRPCETGQRGVFAGAPVSDEVAELRVQLAAVQQDRDRAVARVQVLELQMTTDASAQRIRALEDEVSQLQELNDENQRQIAKLTATRHEPVPGASGPSTLEHPSTSPEVLRRRTGLELRTKQLVAELRVENKEAFKEVEALRVATGVARADQQHRRLSRLQLQLTAQLRALDETDQVLTSLEGTVDEQPTSRGTMTGQLRTILTAVAAYNATSLSAAAQAEDSEVAPSPADLIKVVEAVTSQLALQAAALADAAGLLRCVDPRQGIVLSPLPRRGTDGLWVRDETEAPTSQGAEEERRGRRMEALESQLAGRRALAPREEGGSRSQLPQSEAGGVSSELELQESLRATQLSLEEAKAEVRLLAHRNHDLFAVKGRLEQRLEAVQAELNGIAQPSRSPLGHVQSVLV